MLSLKGLRLDDDNDNPRNLHRILSALSNEVLAYGEAVSFVHLLGRLINNLVN